MWRALNARELGQTPPRQLRSRIAELATSLPLYPISRIDSHGAHRGQSINCLEVDQPSQRFLLSAANDGTVAVFDLAETRTKEEGEIAPLGQLRHDAATLSGVSSAAWFPPDNGIFLTAGYNGVLNVWDTESSISGGGQKRPVVSHLLRRSTNYGQGQRLSQSLRSLFSPLLSLFHVPPPAVYSIASLFLPVLLTRGPTQQTVSQCRRVVARRIPSSHVAVTSLSYVWSI